MSFVTKGDLASIGVFGLFGLVLMGMFALIPDREVSDDDYVKVAQEVALCPAAQSALDRINKDHTILHSEQSDLERIISGYVEQDQRVTKAHNVAIAKGLIRGPLMQRTCLPLPTEPTIPAKVPGKQ